MKNKNILLLQGPSWIFFRDLYNELKQLGYNPFRINLGPADWFHWIGKPATNYLGRIQRWEPFLVRYIIKNEITHIIVHQDSLPYHRIAMTVAKKLNIDFYTCECGYLRPDWVTFTKYGMCGNDAKQIPSTEELLRLSKSLPSVKHELEFPYTFQQIAFHEVSFDLINCFFFFLFPFFSQDRYYHPFVEYLSIIPRLFKSKKEKARADFIINSLMKKNTSYYLFALQLQSDYQIRKNSDFYHISEAMELCLKSFSEHALQTSNIVFKIHPYDYGLEPWKKILHQLTNKYNLVGRTHLIYGGDLKKMIKHSKGLICINSTCGIHSIRSGCSTLVLGNAIYNIPGLTFQNNIDNFWNTNEKPNKELYEAFEKYIATNIQIKGTFHTKIGRLALAKEMASRISKS